MRVLATYNIKGGVGKTASAVNLAYLSARGGSRTLVWDLDPQGAASFYFRIKAKLKGGGKRLVRGDSHLPSHIRGTDYPMLDLLPADFSYRKLDLQLKKTGKPRKRLSRLLQPLAGSYDTLFLDCGPGISLVAEAVFTAADALLVPIVPTTLSVRALEQLRRHLRKMDSSQPRLLPFFCMVDRRRSLHRETCRADAVAVPGLLRTEIPYSSIVERMGVHRSPLAMFASRSAAAKAYEALWREIVSVLEAGPDR
jgi:cellulose biosynthesis protein BcsQ